MSVTKNIKAVIFDWGDTIMRDFDLPGPMAEWDKVEWIPGAEEALKKLHDNFICIIATSANHSDTKSMIAALKRVGAEKYFHHFFSSKDLGYQKPDPSFFISITDKTGLHPEDCIMVGNFYEKDITGAKKAGMVTVFFNENKISGNFPDADVIIFRMDELVEEIGN